jgi:hypothetical protein
MEIVINPFMATAVIGGGIFIVSFLLGRWSSPDRTEEIIENTITHLVDEGYVKTQKNLKGELELIKLED